MRREFYDIYNLLLRTYRIEDGSPVPDWRVPGRRLERALSLQIVENALDEAITRTPLRNELRPDAAHLLLVNLHQMVTLPLLHPEAPPVHPAELQTALVKDIQVILADADGLEAREITGHRIIEVLARVWRFLRISNWELWG